MARQRLRIARAAAGLSLRQLSLRIGGKVTAQAISYYERGETKPSPATLEAIAGAVGVSAEYLAGDGAALPGKLAFRALRPGSRREEAQLEARALQLLERYLTVEEALGRPGADWEAPPGAPWPIARAADAECAAAALREAWGLGAGPVPGLIDLLEARGVKLVALPLPEGDGSLGRMRGGDRASPVIVLNARGAAERRRFAAARELGHAVMDPAPGADAGRAARRFARAFLAPAAAMRAETGKRRRAIGWGEMFALKNLFGMEIAPLTRRCEELGIFGQVLSRRFSGECTRRGWRNASAAEPAAGSGERPRRFERLCLRALSQRALAAPEAAELLGLSAAELKRRMNEPPAAAAPESQPRRR